MSIAGTFACIYMVLILALCIPTLYYAFDEKDAPRQKGSRAGLTLSEWLMATRFTDVSMSFPGQSTDVACSFYEYGR